MARAANGEAGIACIEISEDGRTPAWSAGYVSPGILLVDLLAYLTRTDATSTVLRLRKTRTVRTVVIDPHSPGATLIKPLTDAEVHVTQPSTSDMAVAHGTFLDELAAGRLRHAGQPELDTAVRHGAQRPLGGATGVAATRHASRPLTAVRGDISRLGLLYGAAEYDVLESAW
jgi:hypothetical protein